MYFGRIIALASVLLLTAACGGIKVTAVTPTSTDRVGVPYNMGMTRYDVTIKYSVTQCLDKDGKPKLKVSVDIDAPTAKIVVDAAHMYLLSSSGDFETSDLKSEFDVTNGVSTSLNASAADRTPQIISNAVATIAQIATFAAAAGAPLEGGVKTYGACLPKVGKALESMAADRKAVKDLGDALDAATADVNKWTTVAGKALFLDGRTRANLILALERQAKVQKEQDAAKKKLQKDIDNTTYKFTIHWPQTGDVFSEYCGVALDPACIMPTAGAASVLFNLNAADTNDITPDQWSELSRVHLSIVPADRHDPLARATDGTKDDADLEQGVPARFAVNGRFRAYTCATQAKAPEAPADGEDDTPAIDTNDIADLVPICAREVQGFNDWLDKQYESNPTPIYDPSHHLVASVSVIGSLNSMVLQLGRTYTIPLPSGAFHSGTVALATGDGGALKSVESKVDAAALETATGTLKDTATSATSIYNTISGAEQTRLKAATDALTAKKNFLAAEAALTPEALQTAQLQAQTALYTAESQEIAAQTAAAAAQAALSH